MKQLETAAAAEGYSYAAMMAKAGKGLANVVDGRYSTSGAKAVTGLVGGGNNGGDTLVALTELIKLGWQASAVVLVKEPQLQPYYEDLKTSGGDLYYLDQEGDSQLEKFINPASVLLDGIVGTGFKPPLKEATANAMKRIARHRGQKTVVAVDCPSGVDCVTSVVSPEALTADLTVCMEAVKEGLLSSTAFDVCGEIVTVPLGIPEKTIRQHLNQDQVIDSTSARYLLPKRDRFGHKGTFGRLIVCGGGVNYPGAPNLAAKAAYRAGVGLVEVAIPETIHEIAASHNLESVWTLLESEGGVIADNAAATLLLKLSAADCLLIGPGLGEEETTHRFLNRLLFESSTQDTRIGAGFVPGTARNGAGGKVKFPPLVIDADALRHIARVDKWFEKLPSLAVLTPHPGEMAALTGLTVAEIQADRLGVARKYSQLWKQIVVLKGALTVIADPNGNVSVMPFASSALAKAGTGDVLAGMIASLIAQGLPSYNAAVTGVWLHAQACQVVVRGQGCENTLLAGDLIEALPTVFAGLK
jgi:NAD(P)H-hydrate epimerase